MVNELVGYSIARMVRALQQLCEKAECETIFTKNPRPSTKKCHLHSRERSCALQLRRHLTS